MSFVRTCLRILRSLFPGRNSRDFENRPVRPEAGVEHPAEQQVEHLTVCGCKTYSTGRNTQRNTGRNINKEVFKEGVKKERKDTHLCRLTPACACRLRLFLRSLKKNQSLPEVKALSSERQKKRRSRINQAVRDGCLELYLAGFTAAKESSAEPFLSGEGPHVRASTGLLQYPKTTAQLIGRASLRDSIFSLFLLDPGTSVPG